MTAGWMRFDRAHCTARCRAYIQEDYLCTFRRRSSGTSGHWGSVGYGLIRIHWNLPLEHPRRVATSHNLEQCASSLRSFVSQPIVIDSSATSMVVIYPSWNFQQLLHGDPYTSRYFSLAWWLKNFYWPYLLFRNCITFTLHQIHPAEPTYQTKDCWLLACIVDQARARN